MICDTFYEALAMQAAAVEAAIPDMPEHRFSLRYKRKKKALIKAYEKSKEQSSSFLSTFHKLRLRHKIRVAVLIVLSVLLLTGAGVYITHRFGDLTARQYDTHTMMYVEDPEAPEILLEHFELGYDLTGYSKEIICNDEREYWEIWKGDDKRISFSYCTKHGIGMRMNTEGSTVKFVDINGYEAFYYIAHETVHCLTWDNGDYLFEFDFAGIDYETGIKIAESIRKV